MRVVLGTFARSGIEASLGCDVATGVQAALRHYVLHSEFEVGSIPPGFRSGAPTGSGEDFELAIDPEIQDALEREAQGSPDVSVEQLARHAVLAYLADLDETSGPASLPAGATLARLS